MSVRAGEPDNPSVCFVAPKGYATLAGRSDLDQGGGASVQQVLIATELAGRGWRICFVTHDHAQPDGEVVRGVHVWKMCTPHAGVPMLRFVHPRWTSLCAAMKRADADVYYQRGAGAETGQVAYVCRRRNRAFVFGVASDTNCRRDSIDLCSSRERMLYRYGIRRAARVVAQSQVQVELLTNEYGIRALRIPSGGVDPASSGEVRCFAGAVPRLLWVGRFAPKKRPELLLELAGKCPDFHFDVVADHRATSEYATSLIHRFRGRSNVTLHGWVPPDQLSGYYDRATLLLCTSPVEGFPNTFLEAWAQGTPTVSTFDPDGVIARHGLGGVGMTVDALENVIRSLIASPADWTACSKRARSYFLANHTISHVTDKYEALFREVANRSNRRQSRLKPASRVVA